MTSKELLLAILRGEKTERVGWAPFLTYWWEFNQNKKAESMGEAGFKASVGCDVLMRGHYDRPSRDKYEDMFTFEMRYGKTHIEEKTEGKYKYRHYQTPVGELLATYTHSSAGDTWFLTGHPIKDERDFATLRYVMEDQSVEPSDNYLREIERIPDALFAPLVTPLTKTGFQSMLEYWVGTENLTYALADDPEEVEKTLEIMVALSETSAKICADSQAEAFISWEDTSTTNISPDWYDRYIRPEIDMWCDILHEKNKLYIHHACGHLKDLVPRIAKSKIDALESISDPPTGDITIMDISRYLPDRITLIGGLEPTFLLNSRDEAMLDKIREELDGLKNRRFILANADSCPPQVDVNRFGKVSQEVFAYYGLKTPKIEIY